MAPVGFLLWWAMQWGYITRLIAYLQNENYSGTVSLPTFYSTINTIVAIIGFFSFLIGIYFLTFSKEKIEDEMTKLTRHDSFQFAALVQLICIISGFLLMLIFGDPSKDGMVLFFVFIVFVFWLAFIVRFNYILHIKIYKYEE